MSDRPGSETILYVNDLKIHFPIFRGLFRRMVGVVKAVDGISFDVRRGEIFSLVGESGCGKTSTGRGILQLAKVTSGKVMFQGVDLTSLSAQEMHPYRRQMQMVFQDPYASLNPRLKIESIVGEPLEVHRLAKGKELSERVSHLLEIVGLDPKFRTRYAHEFSGGQRQRIGIARALASEPSFLVCDEPISALDVSIQAQIVNLLKDLQEQFGLAYMFIAHDLSIVRYISDRVAVMYLGQIMELAAKNDLYNSPLHPYTIALLSAVPIPDPVTNALREQIVLEGDIPSPANPPRGCPFNTRCSFATDICHQERAVLRELRPKHFAACHRIDENGQGSGLPPMNTSKRIATSEHST
ncbi:MAG: ABC transporter ATP-binding protein [Anaerolineales bacterium]